MIITRLWGGLGNQMFQYAFGYVKAKEVGTELVLDTRFFTDEFIHGTHRFTKQKLNLFRFPIVYKQTINEHGELAMVCMLQAHRINQCLRIPYLTILPAGNGLKYVKETRMRFQPVLASMKKDNRYYDGYWQTEKYFDNYREELISQYLFCSEKADTFVKNNGVDQPNAFAIHMRMGDYGKKHLTAHYNYVINPEYYKRAINMAKERVANPRFFVCSNNINAAKDLLGNASEYIYVSESEGMTDLDEFSVMSKCPNHIISNSTFSWWAAWLGKQEGAVNYAPNIVFGNKDIIPERWIKVDVEG